MPDLLPRGPHPDQAEILMPNGLGFGGYLARERELGIVYVPGFDQPTSTWSAFHALRAKAGAIVLLFATAVVFAICAGGGFAEPITVAKVSSEVVPIPIVQGDDIRFRRLSLSQGLSQTRVSQIIQDDEGYMWFGTQHGVNRFDGYSYRVFKHEPGHPGSLSGTFIYALFKDRSGTVWVGSDQGLDAFDRRTETFKRFNVSDANPVVIHISQDSNGLLWLSTSVGLFSLDPQSGKTRQFVHDPNDPASLASSDVKSSGTDHKGTFWVANGQGLDAFDAMSGKVTARIPLREAVREFYFHEDRSGVFWIVHGSGSGLATYDRVENELTRYSFYEDRRTDSVLTGVYAVLETRDGTMWFATMGAGLLRFDRELNRLVSYQASADNPESIAENRVIALFEDVEGNVWTGLHATPPNFFPVKAPPFEPLRTVTPYRSAFGEALVNTILGDSRGRVWIGAGGGITVVDRKTKERRFIDQPMKGSPIEVLTIREASDGTIWTGTLGTGLHQLSDDGELLRSFRHDPADPSSLPSDIVTRLHFDARGRMWVAGWNGLSLFDASSGKFTTHRNDPAASAEAYFSITEQNDSLFWLGSTNGLHSFDPNSGTFRRFIHDPEDRTSLSNNTVNTVLVDTRGGVWIGTQNGLNKLDVATGKFTRYFQQDGLAGSVVSCILEAADGRLWMSTNQGVSRLDPATMDVESYTSPDGLPGNDLTGWNACHSNGKGDLFFGGFSGAATVRPDVAFKTTFVPPVVFNELRVADRVIRPGTSPLPTQAISYVDRIALEADQNDFALSFSALSFSNPEAHRYRYRLVGLSDDWHSVEPGQRSVGFFSLPHGPYRLEVQASTSRGPWLDPPAAMEIEILPPWWDTIWFRVFYVLVALLVLVALYRYRLRRIAQSYAIRVDERVAERTRIARELHDSLLQGLHGLVFSLQAVRDLISRQPDRAIQLLDTALGRADVALVEGRKAVHDLRDTSLLEQDLAQVIAGLRDELTFFATRPPALDVFVQGKQRNIMPLVRDEAYRIAREALRNAFKHSGAAVVECELNFGDRQLQLLVRDDGQGMEQTIAAGGGRDGHWGLPGMRERAEKMGGKLEVWSARGEGTELKLTIPAAIAYSGG